MIKIPTAEEVYDWIQSPNWEKRNLDFKSVRAFPSPRMSKDTLEEKDWEIARDVASFANTPGGGYLVIGVADDRKSRKLEGFCISDQEKSRISAILRSRITPPVHVDIEVVFVSGVPVTVFTIQETEGSLCTVKGVVYIRDNNGRVEATGTEIMRQCRRLLGRKVLPAPTESELVNSPYNLPTPDASKEQMLSDFREVGTRFGFRDMTDLPDVHLLLTNVQVGTRDWRFLVVPWPSSFGQREFRQLTRLLGVLGKEYPHDQEARTRIAKLLGEASYYSLSIIMGRIGTLRSQEYYWGCRLMLQCFGGYFGFASSKEELSKFNHRFFLSGVTGPELLTTRLDQFVRWLARENDRLA